MDIGKALGFVFEDEEWIVKILLGTLILLIPIFGQFALMGYGIAIIRNVRAGSPRPLPAWENLGQYFADGFKFWVASIVYALPILILMCPFAFIGFMPTLGGDSEEAVAALSGLMGILGILLGCIAILYGFLLALLTPVIQIRCAESGQLGSCLRFGEVFRFAFQNIGPIALSQIVIIAISLVVVPILGTVTLGLLMLPAGVLITAVSSHMYGQIALSASASTSGEYVF